MENIPDISFAKNKNAKFGLETFSIDYLYDKDEALTNSIKNYHKLKFYMLLFVSEGKSSHYIDFKKYNITRGDLLFIAKNQVHSFESIQKIKGSIVIFTEEFLTKNLSTQDIHAYLRLFNYQLNSPKLSLSKEMQKGIPNIIQSLAHEMKQDNEYLKEDLLRNTLRILLLKCERELNKTFPLEQSTHFKDFIKFQQLVSELHTKKHNAQDYADKMNISYKHLNDICKEFTSKTAKGFIDDYIILEAKRHLSIKEIPIKEIAYSLGFEETTNFTKFFKKRTNFTPKDFRFSI